MAFLTASIQPVAKLKLKSPSEPEVICCDCKEEFPTKNLIMDIKRDSDTEYPSKKKCNQPDCHKSKCWYVNKTLMPTSNDVIKQQDIPRFTCKTCQNNFIEKN